MDTVVAAAKSCATFLVASVVAVAFAATIAASGMSTPFAPQGGKFVPTDESPDGSTFGVSVAISGDGSTAVVGGPTDSLYRGAAWVFTRSGAAWTQQARLVPQGDTGDSEIGTAVALSADGRTAVVGGPGDNEDAGAVWVFARTGTTWGQVGGKLTPRDGVGPARFGSSISISANGTTLVVGGPEDAEQAGAVWIFTRSGANWVQQGLKLTARDERGIGRFGWSVGTSADGATTVVGAPADDVDLGGAWIFRRSASKWQQQARLVPRDASGATAFGTDVSLSTDGLVAIIGGPGDDLDAGAAWLFVQEGSVWRQDGLKLTPNAESTRFFGAAVALSAGGTLAVIGAPEADDLTGAVWAFARAGAGWMQQGDALEHTAETEYGGFGYSLALADSGTTLLVGGPGDAEGVGAVWPFVNSSPPARPFTLVAGTPRPSGTAKAGALFVVSIPVRRSDGRAIQGRASCTASVARTRLRATARLTAGSVTCSMRLPTGSSGKVIAGTITATIGTKTVAKPYSFKIR